MYKVDSNGYITRPTYEPLQKFKTSKILKIQIQPRPNRVESHIKSKIWTSKRQI